MIILQGSAGTATFNSDGTPARYDVSDYPDIAQLDLDEWLITSTGENPETGEHDILDFGYWTEDGEYSEPSAEFRRDRIINLLKDKVYEVQKLLDKL